MSVPARKISVLHFRSRWLPTTQTWVLSQIQNLPAEVVSSVACNATVEGGFARIPRMYVKEDDRSFFRTLLGVMQRWSSRRRANIAFAAKRSHAQLIHSHFGNDGWFAAPVARRLRLPHVVTFYGYDASLLPRRYPEWNDRYDELFGAADCILCEGPHFAKTLVELGCPKDKVHVHHLGVNTGGIKFQPREWDGGEPLSVLLVGAFRQKKGIPDALDALGILQRACRIKVTIIGDANGDEDSQMEKKRILAAVDRNGLSAQTTLLGFQSHEALFREAYRHHVFLSPSRVAESGDTEGGAPVTILEMAATGMPVVSTRHCDIPNVIQHGESGLLADERDIGGIAGQLRWLVDHPAEWRRIEVAARSRIEAEFDSVTQGKRLAGLYRRLISF